MYSADKQPISETAAAWRETPKNERSNMAVLGFSMSAGKKLDEIFFKLRYVPTVLSAYSTAYLRSGSQKSSK